MANIQFRMVHDQTGDIQQGTVENEFDLRMKGYKVLDVGAYDGAMAQFRDAPRVVPPTPEMLIAQEQSTADALLIAQGQFPPADDNTEARLDAGAAGTQPAREPTDEAARREGYEKATVDQLKSHAEAEGIDLGDAKLKAEIVDALIASDRERGVITGGEQEVTG